MKRVNFKKIEIENFLSIGNETVAINFKRGLNIITGINHDKEDSKNGVGKSTIADAVFFCLFGTTIRELKKEEIVNNVNEKNCRVKLEFDVIENEVLTTYSLERKISPTKVYLEINGEDGTKSSMPKTTDEICNIIGASEEVFKNAVIMTVNGTIPFMSQKKVEKRKFCEGLFDLGVFQDMLLAGRQQYNDTNNELSVEETKLNEVKNTLKIYTSQKDKTDTYKRERIDTLLKRDADNTKELSVLNGTLIVVDEKKIPEFNNNIKILEQKYKTIQEDIKTQIKLVATLEEKIHTKTQDIKQLNTVGDMCDKCKRPFTEDDKKSRNEKISTLKSEIQDIKEEITRSIERQRELEDTKLKCTKAIDKQKNNITDINNNIQHNINVLARIDQLNTWNKQIKVDIEALENEVGEFDTLIKDTAARLSALKAITDQLNKTLKTLDAVKHIVSEEGVKSFIIKKLLKILNGKLSYYLNKLDAPCRFKFDEYFNERIINDKGQECSYNNFSSGERKRIDLAILFTFMDIRRLQGNISLNLSFYDEILDTSLDDKGIEDFLEILNERIDKYDEACYIISHKNSAIKTATNDIVFLEKKDGFTTLGDINTYDLIRRQ